MLAPRLVLKGMKRGLLGNGRSVVWRGPHGYAAAGERKRPSVLLLNSNNEPKLLQMSLRQDPGSIPSGQLDLETAASRFELWRHEACVSAGAVWLGRAAESRHPAGEFLHGGPNGLQCEACCTETQDNGRDGPLGCLPERAAPRSVSGPVCVAGSTAGRTEPSRPPLDIRHGTTGFGACSVGFCLALAQYFRIITPFCHV